MFRVFCPLSSICRHQMELHRCQRRGFEMSQWLAEESGSNYSPQPCRQRDSTRLRFSFRVKSSAILKLISLKCLVQHTQNFKWLLRNPINSGFCLLLGIVFPYMSWVMGSSGWEELCSAFVQPGVDCTLEPLGTNTGQIINDKPTLFLGNCLLQTSFAFLQKRWSLILINCKVVPQSWNLCSNKKYLVEHLPTKLMPKKTAPLGFYDQIQALRWLKPVPVRVMTSICTVEPRSCRKQSRNASEFPGLCWVTPPVIIPDLLLFEILFTRVVGRGNKDAGAKLPMLRMAYNMSVKCFEFDIFACNRDFLLKLSVELVWKSQFKVAG